MWLGLGAAKSASPLQLVDKPLHFQGLPVDRSIAFLSLWDVKSISFSIVFMSFIFNQSFNSSQVIIVKVFGDAKSNHRLSSRYLLR